MPPIVFQIIAGLLFVLMIVFAYLGSKAWRVDHLIYAFLVFAAAMTFCYLSARTLKTHDGWRTPVVKWRADLKRVEEQNRVLREGQGETPGIRELAHQLHLETVHRGEAWLRVAPQPPDADSQTIVVNFSDGNARAADGEAENAQAPAPHGIRKDIILYAFELGVDETEDRNIVLTPGLRYLGEFRVESVAASSVKLAPNTALTPEQFLALGGRPVQWALYSRLPADDPKPLAGVEKEVLRTLLPESSVDTFADENRPLYDYGLAFHSAERRRTLLRNELATLEGNVKRLDASVVEAKEEMEYRRTEAGELDDDLGRFKQERDAIAVLRDRMEALVQRVQNELQATVARSRQLAAQLKSLQLQQAASIQTQTALRPAR